MNSAIAGARSGAHGARDEAGRPGRPRSLSGGAHRARSPLRRRRRWRAGWHDGARHCGPACWCSPDSIRPAAPASRPTCRRSRRRARMRCRRDRADGAGQRPRLRRAAGRPGMVLRQAQALIDKMEIGAVKIGIPAAPPTPRDRRGDRAAARAPAGAAGGARSGAGQRPWRPAVARRCGQALAPLLALATVLTPNGPEAQALSDATRPAAQAQALRAGLPPRADHRGTRRWRRCRQPLVRPRRRYRRHRRASATGTGAGCPAPSTAAAARWPRPSPANWRWAADRGRAGAGAALRLRRAARRLYRRPGQRIPLR
jgi:hypothetical protein